MIKQIIETNKNDSADLEKKFVELLVGRLQRCEQAFNSKGVFVKECLFEKENSVDKKYLP